MAAFLVLRPGKGGDVEDVQAAIGVADEDSVVGEHRGCEILRFLGFFHVLSLQGAQILRVQARRRGGVDGAQVLVELKTPALAAKFSAGDSINPFGSAGGATLMGGAGAGRATARSSVEACGTINIPAHLGHLPFAPAFSSGACTFALQVGQRKRIIFTPHDGARRYF